VLEGAEMERRVRTGRRMRRRFHLAADVATLVGAALALIATGVAMRAAADTSWQSLRFLAGAAGAVLRGAAAGRGARDLAHPAVAQSRGLGLRHRPIRQR
jgi:hypothetical protein